MRLASDAAWLPGCCAGLEACCKFACILGHVRVLHELSALVCAQAFSLQE